MSSSSSPRYHSGASDTRADADLPLADNAVVVTSGDGTVFACWIEAAGKEVRWVFTSCNGVQYVGPAYEGQEASVASVHGVVSAWWEQTKRAERPVELK